ncbi:hypothetical protein PLESTB_001318400 [Pleodorina starrii]|uniref:Uncharacterized protein n=1 Tax=Pleodorina starrii TaxID=330485 RepID=A0A9W6BV80_9CHLO|nr:hypothetical protein PLESTM_001764100 [Pleodorina starrii]GLC58101.1 hypothetical protein PLESTB_001318400 [Pleodorina starrii]GLC66789.1 hypothetical protein PLESTF_000474600 [Pleodorina starrii]
MSVLRQAKPCGAAPACRPRTQRGAVVVVAAASTGARARHGALAAAVAASALLLGSQQAVNAVGIESVDLLPSSLEKPAALSKYADEQKQKLADADEAFQNSDTLKALLERSEANKAKNRKDIQNKYCYRQAELGVGDCGGLRYIPGLTDSGKQKTPQWLADLLGVEVPDSDPSGGKSLKELIYEDGSAE